MASTWQFQTNIALDTRYGAPMFALKAALKAAGYVVTQSGDGSSYSPSADIVTHEGTGAGGMTNARAWFVVRAPDGTEWCFQQVVATAGATWRVKHSLSAGFIGGAPAANTVPSAADQLVLYGSGSDASPTGLSLFPTTSPMGTCQAGADSAAPYGFYVFAYHGSPASVSSAFVHDPLTGTSPADTCPFVTYAGYANSTNQVFFGGISSMMLNAHGPTVTDISGSRVTVNAFSENAFNASASTNPFTGDDDELPIIWWRNTTQVNPRGYKGVSTVMRWHMPRRGAGLVATVSGESRIIVGDVSLPWPDGVVPAA